MSRTYKDKKTNKKWNKRHQEFKAGVKKRFKRSSAKKMRKTPLTSYQLDMNYSEQIVKIRIPRNIVKGSLPKDSHIEVTITVGTPHYTEVENYPNGLDIWLLD